MTTATDLGRPSARPARPLPWVGLAGVCGLALILAAVDQVRRGEGADTTGWLIIALLLTTGACLTFGAASGTRWWAAIAWTASSYVSAVLVSHAVGDLTGYNDRGPGTPIHMLVYLPVVIVVTALGALVSAMRRRGDDAT